MGNEGICLLVVNDDHICRNIVSEMLLSCTYEVLHIGRALDALRAICERKDTINFVLTNLHRIIAQSSSDILHYIQKTLNLPTFLISPDDTKIELHVQSNFAAYVINSIGMNDIKNLLEFAWVNVIDYAKSMENQEGGSGQSASKTSHNMNDVARRGQNPSSGDPPPIHRNRKRKKTAENSEESEANGENELAEKNIRVIWTEKLHKKFLEAMEMILPEKPVPNKILEVMNVPGLKRAHVASHLQKYRISMKKHEEDSRASYYGMNLTSKFEDKSSFFPSWNPSLNFTSLHGKSSVNLQPYPRRMAPFQQGPFGINSMAASRNYHPFSINPSRSPICSLSNLRSSAYKGTMQQLRNTSLASSDHQTLLSHKNNHLTFANAQANDSSFLLRRRLKNVSRNMVSSGLRVYGDQTKNMLMSNIPGSTSTSSDAAFMGFRLSSDGKSLAFGQKFASGNNEIRMEISPSVGTSELENNPSLDSQIQHPLTTNNFQVASTAALQPLYGRDQNRNQITEDSYRSFSSNSISQLVSFLDQKTVIHSPPVPPVDPGTSHLNHPSLQDLCTAPGIEEALHCPPKSATSTIPPQQQHFETPANCYSFAQSSSLPDYVQQQPSLQPSPRGPGNEYSVQHPTTSVNNILGDQPQIIPVLTQAAETNVHSSSLSAPKQDSYVPLLGKSENEASFQDPSTSAQQIPHQVSTVLDEENSTWPDGNFSALMDETENSCPQSYWDGFFEDTLFNQLD